MMDSNGNDVKKAYICTYTGRKFYLLEPRLEDIDIFDIAHALSMQCRWTGHAKFHYSIAQHSFYCSFLGPDSEAFDRLAHDMSEAYISDLSRPLKHYTEAGKIYRQVEQKVQHAIAERFGFSKIEPASVKLADNSMLYAEKKQIMNCSFEEAENWDRYDENNGITIEQWTPNQAKQMFLHRFDELNRVRIN